MRVEERQVDGLDQERQHDLEQTPLEREATDEIDVDEAAITAAERTRSTDLLGTMQLILEGTHDVDLARLGLPPREHAALEALRAAVTGKRPDLQTFVFAEDRLGLLEQALAVLQPIVATSDQAGAAAFAADHDRLTGRVHELRSTLIVLEDAQDVQHPQPEAVTRAKPTAPTDDANVDARPGSSLTDGPDVTRAPVTSTLSDGPAPEVQVKPSTLTDGPAVEASAPPSSLGDPQDIEQAQRKKPWWRRPFG